MKQKYAVALQLALKKYQSGFGHFGLKFDQQQPHLHAKTLSQHDDVNRYILFYQYLIPENFDRIWLGYGEAVDPEDPSGRA